MKVDLNVIDIINAFKNMNDDEKDLFVNAIKSDELLTKVVNTHLYEALQEKDKLIKDREEMIKKFYPKYDNELNVKNEDIIIFNAYIKDCMDKIAFGNSDWDHSYALALKCMEFFKN